MVLQGKNILITGASSGIGRSIAKSVLELSGNPILWGRSEAKINAAAKELGVGLGHHFSFDLTNEQETEEAVAKLPKLDGIVLSAGSMKILPVKMYKPKFFDDTFTLNVKANFFLINRLLRMNRLNNPSSIVGISSVSSKQCFLGSALYSSSKAAFNSLIQSVAIECGKDNVRANSVIAGMVSTNLTENVSMRHVQHIEKNSLLGLGSVKHISDAVCFLLSDQSEWITGTELVIDGGYSAYRSSSA